MNPNELIAVANQSLALVLSGSIPAVLAAAGAGLAISLILALTQIQDQSLPTAVKFFAVVIVLTITYVGTASELLSFGDMIFTRIERI